MAVLELFTIKIQRLTIEITADNIPTTPAITYSECYALFFCALEISRLKFIYRKVYFYLVVNTESCIFVPYKMR